MDEYVLGPVIPEANVSTEKRCPSCGEYSVEKDDDGSKLVCVSCGRIVEESALVNQPAQIGTTENSSTYNATSLPEYYFFRNRSGKDIYSSHGYKAGVRRLKHIGRVLNFTPVMLEEATNLFKSSYKLEQVIHKSVPSKEAIAACCVYIVARGEAWPVTKSEIASISQQGLIDIVHWYQQLKNVFGIQETHPELEEIVSDTLSKCGFSKDIIVTAIDIIKLAKSVWLEAGRKPKGVVNAAAFISYRSHNVKEKGSTLKKFCSEYNLENTFSLKHCYRDIIKVLVGLGQELPWLEVTEKNVFVHVQEILQNRKVLVHNMCQQHEHLLKAEMSLHEEKDNSNSEQHSCDNDSCTVSDKAARCDHSSSCSKRILEASIDDVSQIVKSKIRKIEKSLVVYPRSFVANREKTPRSSEHAEVSVSYEGDIDSPTLSSHDIAEDELHNYIKSAEEVKHAQSLDGDSR